MQKKLTVLFAFAIFVLVVGWAITPISAHCKQKGPHVAHCNGDPAPDDGGGTIPVTVTFRDAFGDTIKSDSELILDGNPNGADTTVCVDTDEDNVVDKCPYIDKEDKVGTGILSTGRFFMHLTKGNQTAIRTRFLDFSDCVLGPCTPPFLESEGFSGFSVGPANMSTRDIDLRGMFVEDSGVANLVMSLNLTSVGRGDWRLFFGITNEFCPSSSNIGVFRAGPDTWVIEAEQKDVACLAEQAGGGELIFSGLYRMPFQVIVKKK